MKARDIVLVASLFVSPSLIIGGYARSWYAWGQSGYSFWNMPRKAELVYPDGTYNKTSLAGVGVLLAAYVVAARKER